MQFKLDYPVTFKDQQIDTLPFRRRTARDLVAMDAVRGRQAQFMAMLASMCGQPLQVIQAIDRDDYDRLQEEIVPLLGKRWAEMIEAQAAAEAAARTETDPASP